MKRGLAIGMFLIVLAIIIFTYYINNKYNVLEIESGLDTPLESNFLVYVLSNDDINKVLELSVNVGDEDYEDEELIGFEVLLEGEFGNLFTFREESLVEPNTDKKIIVDYKESNIVKLFKISVYPILRNKETGKEIIEQPEVVIKDKETGVFVPIRKRSGGGGGGSTGGSGGGNVGGNGNLLGEVCGNIIVEGNEVCDGNSVSCSINGYSGTQVCNGVCNGFDSCVTSEFCGDNVVNGNEQCDETITTSICDTFGINQFTNGICTFTFCGDRTVQVLNGQGASEVCDLNSQECVDSNGYSGNETCANDCSQFLSCVSNEYCGDNMLNGNEQCDDGNIISNDGCSSLCIIEPGVNWVCGNGIVEPNEVCDGNTESCLINEYSGTQVCNSTCDGFDSCVTSEFCGDNIINGLERCDGTDLSIYGNGVNQCSVYNLIYESGNLACGNECAFNTNQCVNNVILVPNGLVGFWNFDGNVLDKSNSNINGNVVGNPIYVDGKGGGALSFNGNGDYIDFSDNYDFTDKLSLVAWIKWSGSVSGKAGTIIGKEMNSNKQYYLEINSKKKVIFHTFELSSPTLNSINNCEIGNWCHVVSTWDGSNKKIYLNGILNSQVASTRTMTGNSDSFKVGYSKGTGNKDNYFNGAIDEVRVYNRALTSSEVLQLYNQF